MRMLLPATGTPMGVWQGGIATEYSTSLPLKSQIRPLQIRPSVVPPKSTFRAFGLHVSFVRLYSAEIDFTFILRRVLPPLMPPPVRPGALRPPGMERGESVSGIEPAGSEHRAGCWYLDLFVLVV